MSGKKWFEDYSFLDKLILIYLAIKKSIKKKGDRK